MAQLEPGDQFGGYRIEGTAGRGGMGIVYRAHQQRPDRVVAIKVIAPELAADPSFRERFEQESATAAQIEHPNVIPVYDVGEHGGLLYIAMRYVEGVDLAALLRQQGPLAPVRAGRIISQVAAALDAAHARGLVHRDVKPGNVLIAAGDHVYLTDFGLTKRVAETRAMTKPGMFVGSVDYIAPEQIEGGPVDARADIYALGCVLYEMLSGSVPFPRESELAKLFAHVNEPVPRLHGVPEPLDSAVQRATAKAPAERFLSAGGFGNAVVEAAAGRTAPAEQHSVATGEAAFSDAGAATEIDVLAPTGPDALAPTKPGVLAPTEPGQSSTSGAASDERAARSRPRGRLPLAAGAAAVLVLAAAGVVIALAAGGSGASGSSSSPGTPATGGFTATTSAPPNPPPAATQAELFTPVNASGGLAVAVTRRASGFCIGGSDAAVRSDAWRCTVGDVIADPCFTVDSSHVLCPVGGPWTNTGVELFLPGGLPTALANANQGTRGQPWAVELRTGAKCVRITGVSSIINGQRLNYDCTGGLGLYGNVQRSGPVWMIFVGGLRSGQISLEPITTVWF